MASLDLSVLREAIAGTTAAFRVRARLKPAGGDDDKVFPPTYSGGVYAMEERLIDGRRVPCVLLDSAQSQANRLEEALRNAWERNNDDPLKLNIPMVLTDFSDSEVAVNGQSLSDGNRELVRRSVQEVGRITTLDAPHRIADAILRDSVTQDGQEFREAYARAFDANIRNATALFELCPTALVFGTWDSTGSRGGLGNKFARALVSEIVGINAVVGVRTSSRIDPLAISSKVPIYQRSGGGWTALEGDAQRDENNQPMKYSSRGEKGNPSAVNHSNVTPDHVRYSTDDLSDKNRRTPDPLRPGKNIEVGEFKAGGVSIDSALQTTVLSLPALRRLRFPADGGTQDRERDRAAQIVLAALGMVAITEQWQQGYFLRSRCDLVPENSALVIERVNSASVQENDRFTLIPAAAIAVLNAAVQDARNHNLPWNTEPIILRPKPSLVAMVARSRELELTGEAATEG